MIKYTGNHHDVVRYACDRGWMDNGAPRCIAFGGITVDEAMAKEILRVVEPAAVEAAVLASKEETHKQDEVRSSDATWKRRVMLYSVHKNSTTRRIQKTGWLRMNLTRRQ